jgi:serine/threonine-protein kinase
MRCDDTPSPDRPADADTWQRGGGESPPRAAAWFGSRKKDPGRTLSALAPTPARRDFLFAERAAVLAYEPHRMKFGQYELLERVAVGGMAEVFRGRVVGAEGFEKWVAIKRILPEFAKDDRFISMMLSEARIHSALSHRNIVQIHDLGTSEDGEYFIVLEYVEGHDLRAILEAAAALGVQVPDSLALHIADELAQALHFAHELRDSDGQPLGIIHRDVSPSNVLISNSGEVKLSDFGIAKRRRENSVVGSLKGNLVYMSPEQARRSALDRRTDVFSLGAVLFEMLVGAKIREATDEVNGFRQAASGVVRSARELRPDLPPAYEALLAKALDPDPARRFADAASFGAAIRELGRESERPVGPADLQELIELLNPPRRARSPVDLSRVIRLGPEFRINPAAETPPAKRDVEPPVVLAPATTRGLAAKLRATAAAAAAASPAGSANGTGRPNGGSGNRAAHSAETPGPTPPPAAAAAAPTPAMAAPALPARTPLARVPRAPGRSNTSRSSPPPPPGRRMTPPPAASLTPRPGSSSHLANARGLSALNAVGETPPPLGGASSFATSAAASYYSEEVAMTPPPGAPTGSARESGPFGRQAAANAAGIPEPEPEDTATPQPRSGAHALTGWSAPPAVAPPSFSSRAPSPSGGFVPLGAPSPLAHEDFGRRPLAYAAPDAASDPAHNPMSPILPILQAAPTAEIRRDDASRGGRGNRTVSVIVAVLALLGAAGAVVHFKVIPLEVLAVWNRPAALLVDSEPAGATAFLDGRTLPGKTPLTVEVRRDRAAHRIELSHPGYIVGETSLRFDRAVPLQVSLRLEAEPPPPPPAEPTPAPPSVPPVASEASAGSAAPADLSADGAKGKRARSEHKAGKGAHARTAEAKAARKAARSHKSKASKAGKSRSKSARASKKGAHPQSGAPSGELF